MIEATIAIPFYNNENTLEGTIKSVLNQTYSNWKLVLINDGSTDNSVKIAEKYISDKIYLINDGQNKGLISRLNQAINITETPFFVRMDADDLMTPDRLNKQIKHLILNPEIDLVGSSAYIINEKSEIISERVASNYQKKVEDVLKNGLFIHPTVTGRTEWFKKNLYHQDFSRAEDLELWCRSITTLKYYNFKEPLLFYRDPITMNLNKYKESSSTVRKIIRKYLFGFKKVKCLTREFCKISTYSVLSYLKLTPILNKKRNPRIDAEKLDKAKKIFVNISK